MRKDISPMSTSDPSVHDLKEILEAVARLSKEARSRGKAAAARERQLAQLRADIGGGNHDVARAQRAVIDALARSAEAHESCAEAHEQAARFHERAAAWARERGDAEKHARYGEIAAKARAGAADEARFAQEDRARLVQQEHRFESTDAH
jgi:hypothetical protein